MSDYQAFDKPLNFGRLKLQCDELMQKVKLKSLMASNKNISESGREFAQEQLDELKIQLSHVEMLLSKEPPPPELPPSGELIKVTGVLEEIETFSARGYFSYKEYQPEETARQEANQQLGSVLLAAIGESAAASVNSQGETRFSSAYDFVKGKINGVPFHGWLGMTTAKIGDEVELAVVNKGDHYECYALTVPKLKILSIIPECDRNIEADAISESKTLVYYVAIVVSILSVILLFSGDFTVTVFKDILYFSSAFMVGAVVLGYIFYAKVFNSPKPTSVLAEKIFKLLQISSAKRINLKQITKKRLKQRVEENNDRDMPNKYCSLYSYYYY
ncbi:putative type VI secretion system effector [Klebsiella aerogenes]